MPNPARNYGPGWTVGVRNCLSNCPPKYYMTHMLGNHYLKKLKELKGRFVYMQLPCEYSLTSSNHSLKTQIDPAQLSNKIEYIVWLVQARLNLTRQTFDCLCLIQIPFFFKLDIFVYVHDSLDFWAQLRLKGVSGLTRPHTIPIRVEFYEF